MSVTPSFNNTVEMEDRSVLLGLSGDSLLMVAFTERGDTIRIISARWAERREHDKYYRENGS